MPSTRRACQLRSIGLVNGLTTQSMFQALRIWELGKLRRVLANSSMWDGALGLWISVAPFLSPRWAKGEVSTGVNPNLYDGLE